MNQITDTRRTQESAHRGYRVLRFRNSDVIENLPDELEIILWN